MVSEKKKAVKANSVDKTRMLLFALIIYAAVITTVLSVYIFSTNHPTDKKQCGDEQFNKYLRTLRKFRLIAI